MVLGALFRSLLLSILGLLFCQSATARQDDAQAVNPNFADNFSTLNCYCFGWVDATRPGPQLYRSGSYFGISYYNAEFELQYNRTTWEVRNVDGHLLHHTHDWDLRPKLKYKCHTYEDGHSLCYWRSKYQHHARYNYGAGIRLLPRGRHAKEYLHSGTDECRTICPDVVKLPHVTEGMCRRYDYMMRPICLSHEFGSCEMVYSLNDGF
ncbi:hypothetical protein MMC22_008736 [Lobaria immixta]|nr:hypothetical protein [Lobaria immixta]